VRKIWILLVIITCIVHKAEAGLELIRVSENGRRFVGAELGLPVDCPVAIPDGILERFKTWHERKKV